MLSPAGYCRFVHEAIRKNQFEFAWIPLQARSNEQSSTEFRVYAR
jgi:hypothetical protein